MTVWQMSYTDGPEGRQQFPVVFPQADLAVLRRWARDHKNTMSGVIREAVFDLARENGLLPPSKAEKLAAELAAELGTSTDALALPIEHPKFRDTLEALAQLTGKSLSGTIRAALRAHYERNSDDEIRCMGH